MPTQAEKGRLFKERHAKPGILILPNPWDAGTAKLLQSLGFEALATTDCASCADTFHAAIQTTAAASATPATAVFTMSFIIASSYLFHGRSGQRRGL